MKKSILILYQENDWSESSPDFSDAQNFGYNTWAQLCRAQGLVLVRASIEWFTGKSFSKHWMNVDGKWTKVSHTIAPSVIYDKCNEYNPKTGELIPSLHAKKRDLARAFSVYNEPEFTELFHSKLQQAVIFGESMPKTELVHPGDKIKGTKTKPVVLKNFFGSGGKQVTILDHNYTVTTKMLKQEFIAASKNGVLKDVRIVFLGSEPVYALSRKAKKGSLFTNFHQGASIEFIPLSAISKEVSNAKKIAKKVTVFRKAIFSLDFLTDPKTKKIYLMEINTMPGLDVFSQESLTTLKSYLKKLTQYLLS
jgi:hypothetical protein